MLLTLKPCFIQKLLSPIKRDIKTGNSIYKCVTRLFSTSGIFFEQDDLKHDFVSQRDFFLQYAPQSLQSSGIPHNILVIQPYIKWGPNKKTAVDPLLELEEAVSLIKTLSSWSVASTKKISSVSFDPKTFFRKGQLQEIQDFLKSNKAISAVFVNTPVLKIGQHVLLESKFKMPVFDRYCIILNIFKQHAKSKEAKLLVAQAECTYFHSRLGSLDSRAPSDVSEVTPETRKQLMADYEQKVRAETAREKVRREELRKRRTNLGIPVVAVVGYTNAGKTSLIRVLTGDEVLTPKDQLFATLDNTLHAGSLPRNLKALFADGVGFVSDLPSALEPAFAATLEDALNADLVLAVHDASHPDSKRQAHTVTETLTSLKVEPNKIIRVNNKIDLIKSGSIPENGVSCASGVGLDELRLKIEDALISILGLKLLTFRVASGGTEFIWLLRETSVYRIDVDPKNESYCFLSTILSEAKLNIFKHEFVKKTVK